MMLAPFRTPRDLRDPRAPRVRAVEPLRPRAASGAARDPRSGFTLVEVMVALLVAALVLSVAYAITGAVGGARTRAAEARRRTLPGPAARAALDGWLRSAALLDDGAFVGSPGGGMPPRDALAFSVEDGGALHPGPRRIRLWIERGAMEPRRGLLAEVAPPRRVDGEPPDTLVLSPAAAGLRARYRTRVKNQPVWVAAWRAPSLPEAVELFILPAPEAAADPDAGGLPRVLRIPLLVPLRWNPDASDAANGT